MKTKQRIMNITAKSLFQHFPKKDDDERFCFDTRIRTLYTLVVKEEVEREDCPLFHQLLQVLEADEQWKQRLKDNEKNDKEKYLLYDQLLIMDFEDIFLPLQKKASEAKRKKKEELRANVQHIIENGFDVRFDKEHTVHMMPFDKSGNMSRNARISFVNDAYIKQLNERLNLGMDFSKIEVKLSKYYAYRGLYLSTSQRVEHEKFRITPETLVIVKDKRYKKNSSDPTRWDYENNVLIETATQGENPREWIFQEPHKKEREKESHEKQREYVDTPHDGEGLIDPDYSKYINEALGIENASSFQIRLPFAKGMLHQVDVLAFIDEFAVKGIGPNQYIYEDAFGIERDLRKAHIFMTQSMLKGFDWLKEHCDEQGIEDPMQYYCEMIETYNHGFYVSGTNLPYGHSKYTHLSYQAINTLAFEPEEFERIIQGHGKFIENPIDFIKEYNEIEKEDVVQEDGEITTDIENWKLAVLKNPEFANDKYIKQQLKNIQKSLLTKMATGKILVEGQTRYLCRDLVPLLADLLREEDDIKKFYLRCLYSRFYLPLGNDKNTNINLEFEKYYAFFRSPHLSRNEQYMIRAFVLPESEQKYAKDGRKSYEKYVKYVNMYDKYFGHLTGIVMVPRGSTLPLCLGGADFDGDLVSVIFNQDVVEAVKRGVYERKESESLYYCERVLPAIKIPGTSATKENVPEYVSFKHLDDTFSNYIGQISNAAIAIGQEEYGRNCYSKKEFSANEPTCAKCTLLTGLEIDAAKNGIHPNLDIILNTSVGESGYLQFLRAFRELKAEDKFDYKNLSISEEQIKVDGFQRNVIKISAKDCSTKIVWDISLEDSGTYINLLPKYFKQYFESYKKRKRSTKKSENARNNEKLAKLEEVIIEFENEIEVLRKIYNFYNKYLHDSLKKEKDRVRKAVENTEIHIMQMYDLDHVDVILFEILPQVREKIKSPILGKSDVLDKSVMQEIRNRVNSLQWQFQPRKNRGAVLEQIIGNGFKDNVLTEQERNFLYHFNQQGYKMLWRILDLIEGAKTYDEIYEKMSKNHEKLLETEWRYLTLDALISDETRRYYENNASNTSQIIYAYCLRALRELIVNYMLQLDNGNDLSRLVIALYEKSKSSEVVGRFFWDVFTWEELQCLFEDKGANE